MDGITDSTGHEFEQTVGDSKGQGSLGCTIHGVAKSWIWLSNWVTNYNQNIRKIPNEGQSIKHLKSTLQNCQGRQKIKSEKLRTVETGYMGTLYSQFFYKSKIVIK